MGELLARLRVMLRRARGPVPPAIYAGDVTIDLNKRLVYRAGEEVHLTPTERSLLLVLASEAGKVMTQRQVLQRVFELPQPELLHLTIVFLGATPTDRIATVASALTRAARERWVASP